MTIFWVNQKQRYQYERDVGCLFSMQRKTNGDHAPGYDTMTEVRRDDFIIHHAHSRILAISMAISDCYEASKPHVLLNPDQPSLFWDSCHFCVDTDYVELDTPLDMHPHWKWLAAHPHKNSAFLKDGTPKQQYLCHIADEHICYLLGQALKLQSSSAAKDIIQAILSHIDARSLTGKALLAKAKTASEKNAKQHHILTARYSHDPYIAKETKERAHGVCQLCGQPGPFKDKNGQPYLECHHIIWLSRGGKDTLENTVALCSNCHRRMHILDDPEDIKILQRV